MDKRGRGSWKLGNFHGRHMCIIPKVDSKIVSETVELCRKTEKYNSNQLFNFMILNVKLLRFVISNWKKIFPWNELMQLLPFFFERNTDVPAAMQLYKAK